MSDSKPSSDASSSIPSSSSSALVPSGAAVPAPKTLPLSLAEPEGLAPGSELVLRVMPLPSDVNANGDVFGGWIMAQVDLAGAVLPSRLAKGRITTVAVNEFIFKQPVSLGDLLSFYARVIRVGTTSIRVHVEVWAERNPAAIQVVKVTQADLTYVAIDGQGKPRPVPR